MLSDALQDSHVHLDYFKNAGYAYRPCLNPGISDRPELYHSLWRRQPGHFQGTDRREPCPTFDQGDILLLQNEINNLPYLVDQAYRKGYDHHF